MSSHVRATRGALSCHISVVVLYGVFAAYFAGVMVRLMLTFTPIVCCLGAIAISQTLTQNFSSDEPKVAKHSDKPTPVAKVEFICCCCLHIYSPVVV